MLDVGNKMKNGENSTIWAASLISVSANSFAAASAWSLIQLKYINFLVLVNED